MVGQPYQVLVNLEMPESEQNRKLGMFLVCAEMRDHAQNLRGHSCRSTMMRYKSPLLTSISTWLLSPLLILGVREQKQTVSVELFSEYLDEKSSPVTSIYVEIQNAAAQIYEVNLQVTAKFRGIRYLMFHWPVFSAVIGTTTNLILILIVLLLSWYHWSDTEWIQEVRTKYQKLKYNKVDKQNNDGNNHAKEEDEEFNGKMITTVSNAILESKSDLLLDTDC